MKKIKFKIGHLYKTYREHSDDIIIITKIEGHYIHYYYLDDPDQMLCEQKKDAMAYWYGEVNG